MPFDFEHKAKNIIAKRRQLKIGIVGFGTFGQFLAGRLVAAGHQVKANCCSVRFCKAPPETGSSGSLVHVLLNLSKCREGQAWYSQPPLSFSGVHMQVSATSRTDYAEQAAALGVSFFTDANDFCEEHPDVVILASSILSLDAVLNSLPVQRLRRSTLFVDVLSVKEFPKRLMLSGLPPEVLLRASCHHSEDSFS